MVPEGRPRTFFVRRKAALLRARVTVEADGTELAACEMDRTFGGDSVGAAGGGRSRAGGGTVLPVAGRSPPRRAGRERLGWRPTRPCGLAVGSPRLRRAVARLLRRRGPAHPPPPHRPRVLRAGPRMDGRPTRGGGRPDQCHRALPWRRAGPATRLHVPGRRRRGGLAQRDPPRAGLTKNSSDFTKPAWMDGDTALPYVPARLNLRRFVQFYSGFIFRRPLRLRPVYERLLRKATGGRCRSKSSASRGRCCSSRALRISSGPPSGSPSSSWPG